MTKKNRLIQYQERLQTFFQSDRAILISCIGIALIFWLLVKLSGSFESDRAVHIKYNYPEGRTFVETPPRLINATVSGTGWSLLSNFLNRDDINITFNFGNVKTLTLNRSQIINRISEALPKNNLTVTDVDEEVIVIELTDLEQKKVPIVFNKEISFAPQFNYQDSITLQPDSVLIFGPGEKLENITNWETELFVGENLEASVSIEHILVASNDEQIQLEQKSIQLEIPIEQFTQKTLFLPIQLKNQPDVDSISIFPSKIKLSCVVGLSKFDNLQSKDFTAEVNMKNVSPQQRKNTLSIQLSNKPDYINKFSFTPKSVEFYIIQEQADSTQSL